ARKAVSKAKDVVEEAAPLPTKPKKMARKLATTAIKKMAGRVLESGAEMIRNAADRAASTGGEAIGNTARGAIWNTAREAIGNPTRRRLPIQKSVDVAVPLRVVWEEWMAFEVLPEGVHNVTEIERDGSELVGRTSGPRSADWAAEVLDERERQSFAWQSHEGSDCAGLITFHELSDRLTRVELNLDVVPTSVPETVQLTTHLADRHAEIELRRFKARLELINPDLYEEDEEAPDEEEGADEDRDEEDRADEPENRAADEPDGEPQDSEPEDSEPQDSEAEDSEAQDSDDGPDDADQDPHEDQPQDDLDEQDEAA
ncbi:MAG: hypothetical protein M3Z06_15510, partial [Actinomycetota bacterium]|nr:hypothetical protein [Actinomycetota bacterium]